MQMSINIFFIQNIIEENIYSADADIFNNQKNPLLIDIYTIPCCLHFHKNRQFIKKNLNGKKTCGKEIFVIHFSRCNDV